MAWTLAGLYSDAFNWSSTGKPAPALAVTVRVRAGASPLITDPLATLYTDQTAGTTTANPALTDSNGNLSFFTLPKRVDLWANGQYVTTVEVEPDINDPNFGGASISPATTVTGPDAYGTAAAVGVSTLYARGDHDHGQLGDPRGLPLLGTGLTGATAATRLAGGTAGGHPTSGTFNTGDIVPDALGVLWLCTAGGTPGTWTNSASTPGPPGVNWRTPVTIQPSTAYALNDGLQDGSPVSSYRCILAYTTPGSGVLTPANDPTHWTLVSQAGAQGLAGPGSLIVVDVVATANITLSGLANTIDGFAVNAAGLTVLAVGQTTTSQNGPWVAAGTAWTRPGWFSSGSSQGPTALLMSTVGSVNSDTLWILQGTGAVTVDTTAQTWLKVPFGGGGGGDVRGSFTGTGTTTAFTVTHGLGLSSPFTCNPRFFYAAPVNAADAEVVPQIGSLASSTFVATFPEAPANGVVINWVVS